MDSTDSFGTVRHQTENKAGFILIELLVAWFDQLSPYLGKAKWGLGIFKCPSYKWGLTISDLGDHPLGIQAGSYAYNAFGPSPVNVIDSISTKLIQLNKRT
jgi:hypothetical protein